MKQIKINIFVPLKQNPWGGGNQFLKALKQKLERMGCYEQTPWRAHVILFNSYPFGNEHLFYQLYRLRKAQKAVVHRVDGPLWYTRGGDQEIDEIIFSFNEHSTDGTVFQSQWSREKCYERGLTPRSFETVIFNAPDDRIFFTSAVKNTDSKIKMISTSWSGNPKKGFDIYQFLDEHLDFSKYEFTFIGNSPVRFKNIRHLGPMESQKLAGYLRNNHIFITASLDDPCSNALLEALHCGLPAIARCSGGHPEILKEAGELFSDKTDVISVIERVSTHLERYRQGIRPPSLDAVTQQYYHFCERIYHEYQRGQKPGSLRLTFDYLNLMKKVYLRRWIHCSHEPSMA